MTTAFTPKALVRRRLHSLMGLWLVLFLFEHLFTNSQAALWVGDQGASFVRMVNALHNLPYLHVIEGFFLGIPMILHAGWGIRYAYMSKGNAHKTDGSSPSLPQYGRNRAFSWQRITSWILLIAIAVHVTKFRFLDYPEPLSSEQGTLYTVKIEKDAGLAPLCYKLGVQLEPLKGNEVLAKSPNFGTATLLSVRDTFKNPWYVAFYTVFVAAACFHACNGLWTFCLSWGIIIRRAAQRSFLLVSLGLMLILAFLGFSAIFGTWFHVRSG